MYTASSLYQLIYSIHTNCNPCPWPAGRPLVHNMRSTIVIIAVPAAHHTRPERVLQMSMYFAHQQQQQPERKIPLQSRRNEEDFRGRDASMRHSSSCPTIAATTTLYVVIVASHYYSCCAQPFTLPLELQHSLDKTHCPRLLAPASSPTTSALANRRCSS